jgi:hypothetical protein
MGSLRGEGRRGGLAHPEGNKISSWSTAVEEASLPWGNKENSKTGQMQHQELIMHRVRIATIAPLYIAITSM